ncbi:SDR family oxidoreductase [Saxibacter everestensis]|uniref:SDR family oxidoreductase n=1 Tax=Saxibacter everestensis TaxID=2909229 RepID=A0ABY8QVW5_9MICO|nr:SDR family oxidoreductase [Brevibacteriaceae bacterium ZFBP1038]
MTDQHTPQDPTDQYPQPPYGEQQQPHPGYTESMSPRPDHGEKTYVGSEKLKGRKAVITGADSGIGRAVAIAFAREGADVVLSYLREEEEDAEEAARLVREAGRTAVKIPGNLAEESECLRLIDEAVAELGGLDLLVNVAGFQMARPGGIAEISTEEFDHTFKTNVYSMFWLCKAALPHLKPGSSIINTHSIQAYQPTPSLLAYASTKGAILNFTKGLAQDVAEEGIRVNAVAPGPIWTPLQPATQPEDKVDNFGADTPLGRAGQPAEVAPSYVFLASQESSFITGETIGVTGGRPLA